MWSGQRRETSQSDEAYPDPCFSYFGRKYASDRTPHLRDRCSINGTKKAQTRIKRTKAVKKRKAAEKGDERRALGLAVLIYEIDGIFMP
jgi:hypothetical protein